VSSAAALVVAAIPERTVFVAAAAKLSASNRLAQHNILVRNPWAVEVLGRVDVVCFDKTGTLTEGNIRRRAVSDGSSNRSAPSLECGLWSISEWAGLNMISSNAIGDPE